MSLKSHEQMMIDQIVDLHNKGDSAEAAKVQKILFEHITHQTPSMHVAGQPSWRAGGAGGAGGAGIMADIYRPSPTRPYTHEEQLAMRMGWGRLEDSKWATGFEHVAIHGSFGSTTVHVWVITKDAQSVVLEDEAPLFPSDTLVTKLNMMKQE